ncbi:hypothetical protein V499_05883 [Pseudogymnoascus sp. VKM F-103]|nr:hypothetical protein V499_05883 [Pseudogymnoascus sp. VKM F-103]
MYKKVVDEGFKKGQGNGSSDESSHQQQQRLGLRSPALSAPAETRATPAGSHPPKPPNYVARLTKWSAMERERTA